ncbi:helix-turn-helix transcriptional regulator [uncultured Ruthenibacterium sp.]|uniref:helix-turn-helix transcriptional regulator n=1 Tax=uncultured Ruthenibacterium sp. TaxID=1905347 RepID=UPI00349E910E
MITLISTTIKTLRENMGLSQAALAKRLGVTRASVNAWEMEISSPTAQYLIEMARLFHTSTDFILGLDPEEQIILRGMTDEEKRLVYNLVEYISQNHE